MIISSDKRLDVANSEAVMWSVREQYREAFSYTLVERVCSFLESYPLSPGRGERIAPASAGTTMPGESGHARATRQ